MTGGVAVEEPGAAMSDAVSSDMTPVWTAAERGLLKVVAELAPSVHDTLPWRIVHADDTRALSLVERVPCHDPPARDRLISCGAALTNVLVGLRMLDWVPEVRLLPVPGLPHEVARVVAHDRHAPSEDEIARFVAVSYRRGHHAPCLEAPVEPATVRRLTAHGVDGVAVRWLNGRPAAVLPRRTIALPWTTLDRHARECLLVIETRADGPLDHLRAGMALESMWLTAACAGLVCEVSTQPLQVPEAPAGLVDTLPRNGFPQVVVRLGHPPRSAGPGRR
jgi:hypothetical protein